MFKALGKLIKLAFVLGLLVIIGGVCTAIFVASDVIPQRQPQPSIAYTPPERPQAGPSGPSRPRASVEPEKPSGEMRKPLVAHKVEVEDVTDVPAVYKVNIEVSIDAKPTEQQLRALLMHLFTKARSRGRGMAFDRPNAVFIFAYAKQRYHAEAAGSWVGQLLFTEDKGKQKKEPEINIAEDRLAIMFEPDDDRFGLTEEQRMKVFYRLVQAEDRAMDKAGANAADVSKFDGEKAHRLEEKYIKRICKKYNITREQAKQIAMEGAQKGWPMPPSK